jgi:hypothetical protein
MFSQMFKVLSILYNAFILVQLSCIGYAESFRIKRTVTHLLNQNKQIRVIDRNIEQPIQTEISEGLLSQDDSQRDVAQQEEETKSNTFNLPTLSNI